MANIAGFSPYLVFQAKSGTKYTANSTGVFVAVTVTNDIRDMVGAGGRVLDTAALPAANGTFVTRLPLLSGKNADGTTLAATAASGKFGLSMVGGTSEILVSEATSANTKTSTVAFEVDLPQNYTAGQNLTLTPNVKYTAGGGTVSAHTIDALVYPCADAGTHAADIVATTIQTTSTAAADYPFVITGTSLSPLDRIVVTLVSVIQDTAGAGTMTQQINSVRLS